MEAGAHRPAGTIRRVKLLAADIGNTNSTIGLFADGELLGSWRTSTRVEATDDELAALTAGLLALDGHHLDDLEAVALASVVPPLTPTYARFFRSRLGIEPLLIEAAALASVLPIEIERPSEAGADRLVNALAVRTEFGGPAIVVDLGTSTNFDVLSAEGAYLGGAIAPGLGLSLEALVGSASKLPRIELAPPAHAIGRTTLQAMQSGTVLGYVGLVSGLLGALRDELAQRSPAGARISVVATGGYTHEAWLREVPGIDAIEPDLTLRGVRYAWQALRPTAELAPQ